MTRSRSRKLKRLELAAAMAAVAAPVHGQESQPPAQTQPTTPATQPTGQPPAGLEEVVVTATKRSENLQDVPLSIKALGTDDLEQLHVSDFDDYAKYLPSLSYTTGGPGFSRVFFRGVSSGDNGNHSGPLPSVGQYLDEQPITTIQGALDVHVYDIERIEALAGPQGTLYGASSEAGTIRIITNKPDPGEFSAGYDLEGNVVGDRGGYVAEGFVNVPFGDNTAIRLVGWSKRDPAYISNVHGTRTYATGPTIDNSALAAKDYNPVDTYGARAALRIDLNENWTITPTVMGQLQKSDGAFAYDPSVGHYDVIRFRPESARDGWWQASATVEGHIANFDLVYAGSYLDRQDDTHADYSDYSVYYDFSTSFYDNAGTLDSTQYIHGKDHYARQSHELRVSSPQDWRLRFVAGVFFQRQQHRIEQRYKVDDLGSDYEVTGWSDTIWLTEQKRVDRDYAIFGEGSFDITEKLTFTGGIRLFRYKNSLEGFFGFGDGWSTSGRSGEALCSIMAGDPVGDASSWKPFKSIGKAPCTNLDRTVEDDDYTPKVNVSYRFDDSRMVYFTWSKGFRPGGVNRRGTFPPYKADFLTNYELGWKTAWASDRVRLNGAFFWEDWKDFQFSFLGENGLTNVTNAGGARIWGIESDLEWAATDSLLITAGVSILDGELTEDFCKSLDPQGNPLPRAQCIANQFPNPDGSGTNDFAPEGTGLPIVPDYKLNLTGRYSFDLGPFGSYFQASGALVGQSRSALVPQDQTILGGKNDTYGIVDFSFGIENEQFHAELFVDNAFDERAEITRFTQCDPAPCPKPYIVTNTPRTVGIRFGQSF